MGIHIERLGFYLKDQYSFHSNPEDISLSYCEIIDKDRVVFSKEPVIEEESFKITPENYNHYRKDHEFGGDFNWYSTIHYEKVSIELIL